MLRIFFIVISVCMGFDTVQAQDLYQPRDIKAAYKKGTRSADGKPGKNYCKIMAAMILPLPRHRLQGLSGARKRSCTPITAPIPSITP